MNRWQEIVNWNHLLSWSADALRLNPMIGEYIYIRVVFILFLTHKMQIWRQINHNSATLTHTRTLSSLLLKVWALQAPSAVFEGLDEFLLMFYSFLFCFNIFLYYIWCIWHSSHLFSWKCVSACVYFMCVFYVLIHSDDSLCVS